MTVLVTLPLQAHKIYRKTETMIKPAVDFKDNVEQGESLRNDAKSCNPASNKKNKKQSGAHRKIEHIREQRRLVAEIIEMSLD